MTTNNVQFLCSILRHFRAAGIVLWVFGGWAEELWQMIPARQHNDIDLLYPASSFDHLDCAMASESRFHEIREKRFSHKRAMRFEGVMLEFILVQGSEPFFMTSFFDGHFRLPWPADTFDHFISVGQNRVPVASQSALRLYRHKHETIERSYTVWLQTHEA